uniref:Uncharacterized protein n=1 Tax=Setaria italica TaxID=4555 RepID=K3YFC0_SETIT
MVCSPREDMMYTSTAYQILACSKQQRTRISTGKLRKIIVMV